MIMAVVGEVVGEGARRGVHAAYCRSLGGPAAVAMRFASQARGTIARVEVAIQHRTMTAFAGPIP